LTPARALRAPRATALDRKRLVAILAPVPATEDLDHRVRRDRLDQAH
jgi:hypothetical protein